MMWWILNEEKNPIDITLHDTRYGAWKLIEKLTGHNQDALFLKGYRATKL